MQRLRTNSIALFILLASTNQVLGIWVRSESAEWKTDKADAIVIGKVTETINIAVSHDYFDMQQVTCQPTDMIKGEWKQIVKFDQNFRSHLKGKLSQEEKDRLIQKEDRILMFLRINQVGTTAVVFDWINLSRTKNVDDPSGHLLVSNDYKGLDDEESILQVIRLRVKEKRERKRGLIVEFMPGVPRGNAHDFVITADPQYKQQFLDMLRSESSYERSNAIYNLVSYPGDETEQLLRQMLKDPAKEVIRNYNGEGREITYYPVRQSAYWALRLLGADVELPEPFFDHKPFLFSTGFENKTYFPQEDWGQREDLNPKSGLPGLVYSILSVVGILAMGTITFTLFRKGKAVKKRLWLCVPPIALCTLDQLLTFWGQLDVYWQGQYVYAREGNPPFRWLLQQHPLAFEAGILVWILIFCAVILLVPQRLAMTLSVAIVIGHIWGSATWLIWRVQHG